MDNAYTFAYVFDIMRMYLIGFALGEPYSLTDQFRVLGSELILMRVLDVVFVVTLFSVTFPEYFVCCVLNLVSLYTSTDTGGD